MHFDASILHGLKQLTDVQIVEVLEYYDGPLDGLARYQGREYWFAAVPDWSHGAALSQSRIYVLHEITTDQADQVRAEERRFTAFKNGIGSNDEWELEWETRSTFDDALPVGLFHADWRPPYETF